MDPIIIGIISVCVLIILVVLGVHIGVALSLVSVSGLWLITGSPDTAISILASTFYSAIRDYVFAVVPMFILMGVVLSKADLTQELFDAAAVLLYKVHGGLAMATVLANAIFAAIVGSSVASAAAFSKIAMEPMNRLGYSKSLSLGTIGGSSVLGMLIPPSILFIVYGILTQQSIGKLFVAGIVPGILLTLMYCIGIAVMLKFKPGLVDREKEKQSKTASLKELGLSLFKPWPIALLIVVVLGGIYGGLFTPTEAAGVGVVGSFIIAFTKRKLTLSKFKEIILDTCITSGSILFLLMAAQVYSRMVAISGLVSWLNKFILGLDIPPTAIVTVFVIMIILMGCLIDSISILLLTIPLIIPIITSLKMDMIWFGVVTVVAVETGLITPPFGMSVYTIKSSLGGEVTLEQIFSGVLPFLLMMLLSIAILITFPILSTWLPSLM